MASFIPAPDLVNESNGKSERIAQLYVMSGKNRKKPSVACGDIAAAVKLKDTHTNNTLSSRSFPVVLHPIEFPAPVITSAVAAKNKGDEEKIAIGLHSCTKRTRRSSCATIRSFIKC